MKLELNEISNIPLQQQILSKIKAKILSGILIPDEQLPSIRTFALNHRISVITVQKAYEMLENEGLIYTKRNKGFFIKNLDDKERKIIASEDFKNELQPVIIKAVAEGLDFKSIHIIINQILENQIKENQIKENKIKENIGVNS